MNDINLDTHYTQIGVKDRKSMIATPTDIREEKIEKFGNEIILNIPLENIVINNQVRKEFDQEQINNLATNIKDRGLKQPITVIKDSEKKDLYYLKIGERRYLAHKKLGRKTIKCMVEVGGGDNVEILLDQFSENNQRVDLTPIETAESIMSLKKGLKLTAEALGNKLGISKTHIDRLSRINKLCDSHKDFISKAKYGYRDILRFLKFSESEKNKLILDIHGSKDSAEFIPEKTEKKQYSTIEGIKPLANAITLKLKIHKKERREEIKRKIKICEEYIKIAKQQLETTDPA
jgi:ParB/RepB/Spo0J family partition protein